MYGFDRTNAVAVEHDPIVDCSGHNVTEHLAELMRRRRTVAPRHVDVAREPMWSVEQVRDEHASLEVQLLGVLRATESVEEPVHGVRIERVLAGKASLPAAVAHALVH